MVKFNIVVLASGLAAMTAASPVVKRSGATLAADLKDIGTKLDTLNVEIDKYQGGIVAGLPVQQAATPLEAAINKAASDAKNEPKPMDEASARQVMQAFTDIEPSIKKSTDGVAAKAVAWGSLKGTVKGDMARMKTGTDTLVDALVERAPISMHDQVVEAKSKVDAYFESAVKAVS